MTGGCGMVLLILFVIGVVLRYLQWRDDRDGS